MVGTLLPDKPDSNLSKIRGLYTISDAEEKEWQARKDQVNKLSSLSLFSHQEAESDIDSSNVEYDSERPPTPIDESIKAAPKTYAGLSKLIYRRINPRPEWTHISQEDQSSLGAVIMGEVNAVWPLLRRQLADPFLTNLQNKELQRRIIVHCVTVCEQLFIHYAEKVKILNSRGIFTAPANMSRIRAQLALEAGKYLNILSVRRHVISDLKKPPPKEQITFSREEASGTPASPMSLQTPSHLSFRKLIKSSRPKRKLKYQFNLKAEINSMQTQMPSLNLKKVHELGQLTDRSNAIFKTEWDEQDDDIGQDHDDEMKPEEREPFSIPRLGEERCNSEPILPHNLILDELLLREKEEEEEFFMMRSSSRAPHSRLKSVKTTWTQPDFTIRSHTSLGLERVPPPGSSLADQRNPKEDLKLLIAKQERQRLKEKEEEQQETDEESSDIPPLIQALTRREAQNENLRKLKKQEKDLDAKYEEEMQEKMKPLPNPQFPQPPIVQSKLTAGTNPINKRPITIRASDVKINDRVDLSSVTLEEFVPVYNDLTGDISQATVKELDANLFQGGELREVYTEIMKTVPNVHQHYDNDPLIVNPGTNVDLSKILASSTLVRPRSQQVINPKLRRDELDMPWEGQQIVWPKGTTMQAGYPPSDISSMSQAQGEGYSAFHRFTPSQLNHPGIEKGSRAYASWLQWWKNTVNSDDFFKYLSTQDTDFLSVLFHFYDSDAADSETESMRTAKMEARREREKKMAELKREKEEYIPGLWNVKSIMLGGLGKDPEIEGEEDEFSDFATPQSTERSRSFSQSGSRSLGGTPRTYRSRSGTIQHVTASSGRTQTNASTAKTLKFDRPQEPSIQERLEVVWYKLKMPDSQKLNSALKYSTDKYIKKLPDIVSSWEHVTDLILEREKYLTSLESFEKEASDPNRFFERGHRGSSVARLTEAKTRATMYKRLENVEMAIRAALISIQTKFSDTVTYNGRPYHEKMEWDKIEMLFYLQQERRCMMLKEHGHGQPLNSFLGHGQARVPTILPPTSKRFTQLPLNSIKIAVPE